MIFFLKFLNKTGVTNAAAACEAATRCCTNCQLRRARRCGVDWPGLRQLASRKRNNKHLDSLNPAHQMVSIALNKMSCRQKYDMAS